MSKFLLTGGVDGLSFSMSFAEVLQELPSLTLSQRQLLIRRALDLDDPALPPDDTLVVEKRLAAHRENPSSAIPMETMKARLRSQFNK